MPEMTTVTLATTGMHCGSCSMLIDMTVGDMTGVSKVKSDVATGKTEVILDADAVSVEDVIAAIRALGYDAEVL